MCKLPPLLRYFQVPANASYAELRQAYLQRAKQVHPDHCSNSRTAEFVQLQQKFEEAAELFREREHIEKVVAWRADENARTRSQAEAWQEPKTPKPPSVPSSGLPSPPVYFATSVFAAAAAAFLISQRRQPSPTVAAGRPAKPVADPSAPVYKEWPPLQSGPWSVMAAKTLAQKTVWAPSKAYEFQENDNDNFYQNRAKGALRANIGHRSVIGKKQETAKGVTDQGFADTHEPHIRDDVEMLPVHMAAADGNIWWLEHCGASVQCRGMLNAKDSVSDTPLHHSAKNGQALACQTLLRLGADIGAKNGQELIAEDVAKAAGQDSIVELLRKVQEEVAKETAAQQAVTQHHPDGLGIHAEPPEGIIFTGLQNSGCLRRAVNMAAGFNVTPPLPVSQGADVDRTVNIARGSLQSTEFDIEDLLEEGHSMPASTSHMWQALECDGVQLCGLLVYEPPGIVTEDAPGHWVAVRRVVDVDASTEEFFRLDPVRGPFRMSSKELGELLGRYRVWRVIRKGDAVRHARLAQLGAAHTEAAALLRKRDGHL